MTPEEFRDAVAALPKVKINRWPVTVRGDVFRTDPALYDRPVLTVLTAEVTVGRDSVHRYSVTPPGSLDALSVEIVRGLHAAAVSGLRRVIEENVE